MRCSTVVALGTWMTSVAYSTAFLPVTSGAFWVLFAVGVANGLVACGRWADWMGKRAFVRDWAAGDDTVPMTVAEDAETKAAVEKFLDDYGRDTPL